MHLQPPVTGFITPSASIPVFPTETSTWASPNPVTDSEVLSLHSFLLIKAFQAVEAALKAETYC